VGEASTDLRRAVATVVVEGGHGSGFFVGGAGHLITNAHVVEGLHFVTVRLVTGRELVGEVLRRDPERDVALVRVEEAVPGLPVRGPEPNVGEEVYAVGAPLEKALHTTVSRGIVSAYRTDPKGQRLIQGDVNVLPGNSGGPLVDDRGNVVGLTVSGRLLDGVPSGINFFIPIHDALDRLHVTLAASEG
jgi:S1-C subfamily serine protease